MLKISKNSKYAITSDDLCESLCLACFGTTLENVKHLTGIDFKSVSKVFNDFCSQYTGNETVHINILPSSDFIFQYAQVDSVFEFTKMTQNQYNVYRNYSMFSERIEDVYLDINKRKDILCVDVKGGNKVYVKIK